MYESDKQLYTLHNPLNLLTANGIYAFYLKFKNDCMDKKYLETNTF